MKNVFDVDELRAKLTGGFCMKCNQPCPEKQAFCSQWCEDRYTNNPPLTPLGEALCDPDAYSC